MLFDSHESVCFLFVVIDCFCFYLQNACMEIRKCKEMEYEILTSSIKGWSGEVTFKPCISVRII